MAHGAEAQQCGRPLACGPGSLRSESQAIRGRGGGLLKVGGSARAGTQCPNSGAGGSESESESESEQRNPRTPRAAVPACALAPGAAGQAHIARTIRREVTVLIRSTAPCVLRATKTNDAINAHRGPKGGDASGPGPGQHASPGKKGSRAGQGEIPYRPRSTRPVSRRAVKGDRARAQLVADWVIGSL